MPRGGANFGAEELACVLSRYDLGTIEKIKTLKSGNTQTPKKVIVADKAMFLLKRRPRGKDDIYHVAFSHAIQAHLAAKNFPVAPLVPTLESKNTALHMDDHVYEVFDFMRGDRYPTCPEDHRDAGRLLAIFHRNLSDFQCQWKPLRSTFHDSTDVRNHLRIIASERTADRSTDSLQKITKKLLDHYERSVSVANDLDYHAWPEKIVHGDWHPGNMLFASKKVLCVVDFDSVKIAPAITDLSNALLQFSIIAGDKDPAKWPANLNLNNFREFLYGYLDVCQIEKKILTALAPLMIETMIAEAVLPIAATGSFGHMEGLDFLKMILRKSDWIYENQTAFEKLFSDLR